MDGTTQRERVRFIDRGLEERFYYLHHDTPGQWWADVVDERPGARHFGPFSSRGEAIAAAESWLDRMAVVG